MLILRWPAYAHLAQKLKLIQERISRLSVPQISIHEIVLRRGPLKRPLQKSEFEARYSMSPMGGRGF